MATKKLDEYIVKAFKDLGFSDDEITNGCWLLERENKKTGEMIKVAWIAYHKFLERAAQMAGITFDEPKVLNLEPTEIALFVNGKKGDFSAWAIGEASQGNLTTTSKNYRWAMAEKRAKDRVILKLLGIAGDMYSEEEADEFKEKPQKTDFEKAATAEKSATTKAINQAIKTGAAEVKKKPKTIDTLKNHYQQSIDALNKINDISELNNTQIDFINNLAVELFEAGLEVEHDKLCDLYNQKNNINDFIPH